MDGSEPDSPDLHLDAANPAFLQNIEHEVDGLMTSRADESTCVYVRNHSRVEMNVYFYCGVTYVVSGERPGIVLNLSSSQPLDDSHTLLRTATDRLSDGREHGGTILK